jgi:hypothetical protein
MLPLESRPNHAPFYLSLLQGTVYDMANLYFNQLIRDIKSHKSSLNKTIHAYLFIRHSFKIGFYSEMKAEYPAAHKHYAQAYYLVAEVKRTPTNVTEVKVVASYIMYKMAALSFVLNQAREAIQTFHGHVDKYKFKFGESEDGVGWKSSIIGNSALRLLWPFRMLASKKLPPRADFILNT